MPCHWESSERPLFVKSVWQNGYRHAILTKEDPAAKSKSPRLRLNSQNFQEGRPNSTQSEENLNIPTVQMLLANAKRIKNSKIAPPKRDNYKKLQKSLTFDVILREDIKITSKNKLNMEKNVYSPVTCEKTIFATDKLEQNRNSLTERVLLWLDLAGKQNKTKNYTEYTKKLPDKQHSLQEFPKMMSIEDTYDIKDIEVLTEFERFDSDFSILNNRNYEPAKIELGFEKEDYTIANVEGKHVLVRKDCIENKFQKNTKRKVHIFIPNIANKIPECLSECSNSIISVDSPI